MGTGERWRRKRDELWIGEKAEVDDVMKVQQLWCDEDDNGI